MKYLYRAGNALLALAIFPIAYFMDLIYVCIVTTEGVKDLLGTVSGFLGKGEFDYDTIGVEDTFSIKRIIDIFNGTDSMYDLSSRKGTFTWPAEAFEPIDGRINAVVVLFAVILVVALFIVVWSICSNKRLPIFIASVAGLASTVAMLVCFNSAAQVITSGGVDIMSLLLSSDNSILETIIGFVGDSIIKLDSIVIADIHKGFIGIFIALIVWSLSFYLVELGDKDEAPKAKKVK